MKRRIFIAINLPGEIKEKLGEYQSKWPDLPVRWTKKDNLHITLIFIGYVSDEELLEICKTTREMASRNPSFSINLNNICYGPPKKMPPRPPKFFEEITIEKKQIGLKQKFWRPRMVWAEGERIKELTDLKNDLEKSLINSGINFSSENREFKPHITLGRIKIWEWRRIEPEERPEINEEISFIFNVKSIEVMESELKPQGPKYTILETYNLKL